MEEVNESGNRQSPAIRNPMKIKNCHPHTPNEIEIEIEVEIEVEIEIIKIK